MFSKLKQQNFSSAVFLIPPATVLLNKISSFVFQFLQRRMAMRHYKLSTKND